MIQEFPYSLYLVISQENCMERDFLWVTEEAIRGGVDIVQLREKNSSYEQLLEKARQLKEVTDRYNIPLIINDNVEIALQTDAAGVHTGMSDMPPTEVWKLWNRPEKILGYSVESTSQLESDEAIASGYLGVSPVFSTPTKTDTATEWGMEGLAKIRTLTTKPLVAIGGMNMGNAGDAIRAGADCIAVVSAICGASNPRKAAYGLKNKILKSKR